MSERSWKYLKILTTWRSIEGGSMQVIIERLGNLKDLVHKHRGKSNDDRRPELGTTSSGATLQALGIKRELDEM